MTSGPEPLLAASHDRARSFIPVPREREHLTRSTRKKRFLTSPNLFEGYIEAVEHILTQQPKVRIFTPLDQETLSARRSTYASDDQ